MLILLPAETNAVLKEKYCKKNIIRYFCFSCCKMIFTLLTKIVAGYIVVTSKNVRIWCFKRCFWKIFLAAGLVFIPILIISYIALFIYIFREALKAAKAAISILKCFESKFLALTSLFGSLKGVDGNLDKFEPQNLVKTWLWIQ